MALRHTIIVICRWTTVSGVRKSLLASEATAAIGAVDDITGQQVVGGEVRTAPDVMIVRARDISNGAWNAINADARFYVLARQTWDDADEDGDFTFNNFDDAVTAEQVSTFISDIQTRYPDVDTEHLKDAGQAVIKDGLTRQQVAERLVKRWKRFAKVLA